MVHLTGFGASGEPQRDDPSGALSQQPALAPVRIRLGGSPPGGTADKPQWRGNIRPAPNPLLGEEEGDGAVMDHAVTVDRLSKRVNIGLSGRVFGREIVVPMMSRTSVPSSVRRVGAATRRASG